MNNFERLHISGTAVAAKAVQKFQYLSN